MESETSISAVERFFAAEADGSKMKNITEALDVATRWLNKMGETAAGIMELTGVLARARVRTWFTGSLKEYVDHKEPNSKRELVA